MRAGLLITQRSRVQIPPPLLVSQVKALSQQGEGLCVSGTVVKRVAATALRAARQRDGGDGVTRDETAWTWWTLPLGISGCLAQRYRKCIPVSSHSCRTSRNMRNPGLGRGRQRLSWHRLPGARDPPLLESDDGVAGRRGADAAAYFLQRALPAQWVCPGSPRV